MRMKEMERRGKCLLYDIWGNILVELVIVGEWIEGTLQRVTPEAGIVCRRITVTSNLRIRCVVTNESTLSEHEVIPLTIRIE